MWCAIRKDSQKSRQHPARKTATRDRRDTPRLWKSRTRQTLEILSGLRGISTQKATLTYCTVDGTNDNEACHDIERPEQGSERSQFVSPELYALVMEEGCDEGEKAKGTHLENESCN